MRCLLVFAFFLSSLVSLSLGDPSTIPSCFVCPPMDLAARPLIDWNNADSQLFCRFQTIPNDFFCKYFTDTGFLKQDHDDGFCPPVAAINCGERKRSYPVLPRSPRVPQPGARSLPPVIKGRAYLGIQRRRDNAA